MVVFLFHLAGNVVEVIPDLGDDVLGIDPTFRLREYLFQDAVKIEAGALREDLDHERMAFAHQLDEMQYIFLLSHFRPHISLCFR